MCVGLEGGGGGVVQYTCQFFFTIHFNNASFNKCDLSESLLVSGHYKFFSLVRQSGKITDFFRFYDIEGRFSGPLNMELNC